MLIKNNVTTGLEWRFGSNWPGERCGAKTRKGTPCQRPANKKNGRCRLHGGASSGPRTEVGRARISAANLRHGKYTKDKLEKRRENAAADLAAFNSDFVRRDTPILRFWKRDRRSEGTAREK